MWVAFTYTDGNGNRNSNCDANAYSNAGTKGYANSATAPNSSRASAVSSGAISAFFGDSRSNSRVPVLYLRARQGKDKGWNGHRGDS